MTRRVSYKGYIIQAHPHQLADGGRWTVNITIEPTRLIRRGQR